MYNYIQRAARGGVVAQGEMGREKARERERGRSLLCFFPSPVAHLKPCRMKTTGDESGVTT